MNPFLTFGDATFGPTAFAAFVLDHPEQLIDHPAGPIILTPERRAELMKINGQVNQGVEWIPPAKELVEPWHILIGPDGHPAGRGDCCSIAATKREMLLKTNRWPAGCLLFAEVEPPEYPHQRHMIVVVRTTAGDIVLDNITPGQVPIWHVRNYKWLRVQSPTTPHAWMTVKEHDFGLDPGDVGSTVR